VNIRIYFTLAFAVALSCGAQTNPLFTNHVPIGNRGLSFTITDETNSNHAMWFSDTYLFSDVPLYWILDNTTNVDAKMHFDGFHHAFALKLFDQNGNEMPLTDFGKKMVSGPPAYDDVASDIHFIGLSQGLVDKMDFPRIDTLFEMPKPGEYVFEARYWYQPLDKKIWSWELSDPIRLKVEKKSMSASLMPDAKQAISPGDRP